MVLFLFCRVINTDRERRHWDNEKNWMGESHSPTYDRTVVHEKTQKTGTLWRVPGVADIRNSEARQVQIRREEDQMP